MFNFMCQPGWAMVLRYWVNYYSRYFAEGFVGVFLFGFCFFGIELTFKSVHI